MSQQRRIIPSKKNLKKQPLKPTRYLWITVASLLLGIFFFLFINYLPKRLTGISEDRFFYIILFLCGISAASFLFGVMHSVAAYQEKTISGVWNFGGPIIAFILAIIGGFNLPKNDSFNYTINLQSENSPKTYPKLENATLSMQIGNDWKTAKQLSHEDFDFKEIPGEYRNAKVELRLDGKYWQLEKSTILLSGKTQTIALNQDGSLSRIEGEVKDSRTGNLISEAILQVLGITDTSDTNGVFEINIPFEKQRAQYTVSATAKGYNTVQVPATPNTGTSLSILLTKNRGVK